MTDSSNPAYRATLRSGTAIRRTATRDRRYVLHSWRGLQEAVVRAWRHILRIQEADRRRQEPSRQPSRQLSRTSSPLPALILNPPANSQDHRLASWRATALSTR